MATGNNLDGLFFSALKNHDVNCLPAEISGEMSKHDFH